MVRGAHLVEILLEVGVDSRLHGLSEPLLLLHVPVAEVVALAARQEVKAGWLIWALGASIGCPGEAAGGFVLAGVLKGAHAVGEEHLVGCSASAGSGAGLEGGNIFASWKRADGGDESKSGSEELHFDCSGWFFERMSGLVLK